MAKRPAAPLLLREGDRKKLSRLVHSTSVRAGLVQRARILLLAADGVSHTEIAEKVGATRTTVIAWGPANTWSHNPVAWRSRRRLMKVTASSSSGNTVASVRQSQAGVTHWSSRLLATRLGNDHSTVANAWREYGFAPWREGTFKFYIDPAELLVKVVDVVGLYHAPTENAVVLCVDEKSQTQASSA